uniref:(northern house mosquito) hypothetical protein n=1 Tax=Culex pipiens TaxID=7175 RepID=A0A8D8AU57_CULPI
MFEKFVLALHNYFCYILKTFVNKKKYLFCMFYNKKILFCYIICLNHLINHHKQSPVTVQNQKSLFNFNVKKSKLKTLHETNQHKTHTLTDLKGDRMPKYSSHSSPFGNCVCDDERSLCPASI